MESGLTRTPEQTAEARRQSRERMKLIFGGKIHDGSQPTVEETLAAESARLGVPLAVKKEGD
jgi:hypothetical protein